jgi:hypothetical protein
MERNVTMISDWFQNAAESTQAALALTAKYQQESMWRWAELMSGSNSIEDWQERARTMAAESIPAMREHAERHLLALEEVYQKGMYLLCQSAEIEGFQSMKDLQSRTETFWQDTLSALRVNTQNFLEANRQAMESWVGLTRRNSEERSVSPQARRPPHPETQTLMNSGVQ